MSNIQIDFLHQKEYTETPGNAVGATTSQTLRTVESYSDSDAKHVRKFGTAQNLTAVSSASLGNQRADSSNTWKWEFRGNNSGTLLGTLTDDWIDVTGGTTEYSAGDFDSPNDNYDFTGPRLILDNSPMCILTVGTAGWDGTGVGASAHWWGDESGNPAGVVRFKTYSPSYVWSSFDTQGDGMKTYDLPKLAHFDGLGGTIQFYWKRAAWVIAFTSSNQDVVITTDGSVYKGSISTANLVVNGSGETGTAGGGTGKADSTFTQGSTLSTAEQLRIDLVPVTGDTSNLINGDTINYNSDSCNVTAETISSGSLAFFPSGSTISTYYDSALRYGGWRHTPDGTAALPYRDIMTAYAALGGAFDKVVVLDSEYYNETFNFNTASSYVFAALGQTPTLIRSIGASVYRSALQEYNNADAIYFNENGNDTTGDGTWQNPYKTGDKAHSTTSALRNIIYGGTGAGGVGDYTDSLGAPYYADEYRYEADHYYAPMIRGVTLTEGGDVYGFIFDTKGLAPLGAQIDGTAAGKTCNIISCSFKRYTNAAIYDGTITNPITVNIKQCYFENNNISILLDLDHTNLITTDIDECIFDGNADGITVITGINGCQVSLGVTNCVFKSQSEIGLWFLSGGSYTFTLSGTQEFNTFYNNNTAIQMAELTGTFTLSNTMRKSIINGSTEGIDTDINMTISYFNFYDNTDDTTGLGTVTHNNPVTGDTRFCSTLAEERLGLSFNSVCFKTDGAENDIGANLPLVLIGADSVDINGFIFDGLEQLNNGIAKTGSADHQDTTLKWCTMRDFEGIAIDDYSGTQTNSDFDNLKIHDNGAGIAFAEENNNVYATAVYSNAKCGIYADAGTQIFNHCALFNNNYGFYFDSSAAAIVIQDTIIAKNGLYGIYSASWNVIPEYICISDAVTANVNISGVTILENDPLFVDETLGSEDLRIKTTEGGYTVDSVCKDAASTSDFPDLGAYDITRTTDQESWKKYVLHKNPSEMDEALTLASAVRFYDAHGNLRGYYRGNRRVLPFRWRAGWDTGSNENQMNKIRYFQSLIPSLESGLNSEQCEFRIHLLPDTFNGTGTSATVSASGLSLTDSGASWIEDEKKGWWVAIKFKTGTGSTLSASGKTLTKVGDFTGEDWTGYYLYYNAMYFLIRSNTDDVLTLSDEHGYLSDEASYAYAVVAPFKVTANDATVLTLNDDDSLLIDGSYDFFIDYILCRVLPQGFSWSQPVADYCRGEWKRNYRITFEEVD